MLIIVQMIILKSKYLKFVLNAKRDAKDAMEKLIITVLNAMMDII